MLKSYPNEFAPPTSPVLDDLMIGWLGQYFAKYSQISIDALCLFNIGSALVLVNIGVGIGLAGIYWSGIWEHLGVPGGGREHLGHLDLFGDPRVLGSKIIQFHEKNNQDILFFCFS